MQEDKHERYDKETVYLALKLIESLYRDERISKTVYRNILKDYRHIVDFSRFR